MKKKKMNHTESLRFQGVSDYRHQKYQVFIKFLPFFLLFSLCVSFNWSFCCIKCVYAKRGEIERIITIVPGYVCARSKSQLNLIS